MLRTVLVAFLKQCKDRFVIRQCGCVIWRYIFSDVVDAVMPTEARIPLLSVVDIPPNYDMMYRVILSLEVPDYCL